MFTKFDSFIEKYKQNETKFNIGIFVLGFIFDLLTLSNIDDTLAISQQAVYLILLFSILWTQAANIQVAPKWEKIWSYRDAAFHFILGSLLSLYSLFYTKSASISSSLIFILVIGILLIANETRLVQKSDLRIKSALATLCLFSFLAILVPIVYGSIGFIPFFISSVITLCLVLLFQRRLSAKIMDKAPPLFLGNALVVLFFCLSYLFKVIPPVPLSTTHMGIYHMIEKADEGYKVSHEKPFWKFWHTGDQDFIAQPGDRIYFFTQIFSPTEFRDQVWVVWEQNHPKQGWVKTDRIPLEIKGGRREGFRGVAYKSNFESGFYRVRLTTSDDREIGRITVNITKILEQSPRDYFTELY